MGMIPYPLVTPSVRLSKGNFRAGESSAQPHAATVNQIRDHRNRLHVACGVAIHGLHELEQSTGGRECEIVRFHPFLERDKGSASRCLL